MPDCPEPARRSASPQLLGADITAAPIGAAAARDRASCAPRQLRRARAGPLRSAATPPLAPSEAEEPQLGRGMAGPAGRPTARP